MNLKIFQADKGDCLLLEADSGELVLCDGGMANSMREYVRDELAALRAANRALEYVYISHIDSDHISGVLQLLNDEVEWRVFDHHQQQGTPVKPPKAPRPPVIKGILHNAFRDQVTKNQGEIASLLAATAPSLFATAVPQLVDRAREMQDIATSIPEALKVSGLARKDALDIPVNMPPGATGPARLLVAGQKTDKFSIGSMQFTLVGPTNDELKKLRAGWQTWLRNNKDTVKKIRTELKRRIDGFSAGTLAGSPFDLRAWNGVPDHEGVSAPNIASLMYMVEENGKRLLLTGDGQQDFILAGLERAGFLGDGEGLHLDVLKVQHHGSEHNLDAGFAHRVSARHYVFSGNGEHGNPDPSVLDFIWKSRTSAKPGTRALAAPADAPFTFWFSTTSSAQPEDSAQRSAFEGVEAKVTELVAKSNGRMTARFNKGPSIKLAI
jgi:beta-lactamase superfamily II metal-dependent hydrolase